ncbi:hypothetical protein BEN47_11725 [Hymenobacter lapidarius]|uniref:Uncharacterized protein n=1 Tax=Hymenobacter lapidarius TaxID=1908237 RepID=A0A1G1T8C4_9BACT|nr:hypothetical protein BEN47_11725 [Hymenobacter lapidarius]
MNQLGALVAAFAGGVFQVEHATRAGRRAHAAAHAERPDDGSPRWRYCFTSMPISHTLEQLPHEIHWPPLVVMRKREKCFWSRPR